MSEEEQQQQRAKLVDLFQKPYEDVKAYGRRFTLATQRAYPAAHLANLMIQEQLIRIFITGLSNEAVRHDVYANRPNQLQAAINQAGAAAHTVALAGTPSKGERQEEAMEIGALDALPPPPPAWVPDHTVKVVQEALKKLQDDVNRLREKHMWTYI